MFITSYQYATIAAEKCENRAVAQSLVAGAGFATSAILAWLGLAWLLRAHTNEHDVRFTSAATFAAIVLIAVFMIRALVEDASEAVRGRQLGDDVAQWVPVASMVAIAALGGLTFHPRVRAVLSSQRAAWLFKALTTVSSASSTWSLIRRCSHTWSMITTSFDQVCYRLGLSGPRRFQSASSRH